MRRSFDSFRCHFKVCHLGATVGVLGKQSGGGGGWGSGGFYRGSSTGRVRAIPVAEVSKDEAKCLRRASFLNLHYDYTEGHSHS